MSAKPMKQTAWHNPTKHRLSARIFQGPDEGYEEIVWEPGQTVVLNSKFDPAIQQVRDGRVVAGLVPQLVREGEKLLPIDPAIDSEATAARERELATQKAVAAKAAADLAVDKAAEAEAKALADAAPSKSDDSKGRGQRSK